jgi:hypothetical protein
MVLGEYGAASVASDVAAGLIVETGPTTTTGGVAIVRAADESAGLALSSIRCSRRSTGALYRLDRAGGRFRLDILP